MAYHITLATTRQTRPDNPTMAAAIKAATGDATAILTSLDGSTAFGKKATPWTAPQIAAAQSILDTSAALTPQVDAQRRIDAFPIEYRALVLALIDALNVVRAALPTPLPPITPATAIAAIRSKAGTL